MGYELAGAIVGFTLVGYLVGQTFFESPRWGVVVGAMLGVLGGLYNLVRQALALNRGSRRGADADREE